MVVWAALRSAVLERRLTFVFCVGSYVTDVAACIGVPVMV
jgi:hypothetical protein